LETIINILINPYYLLFLAIILVIVTKLIFKVDYINCFEIIDNHINNFRHNNKLLIVPFCFHFILPLILGIATNNIKTIDTDVVNITVVIFSILTSMLFTLLVLILNMKEKVDTRKKGSEVVILKSLIKETYYTIMFEILVAILVLILCFISLFANKISCITSGLTYYLTFLFIINLFMVVKRIHKIIEAEMKK